MNKSPVTNGFADTITQKCGGPMYTNKHAWNKTRLENEIDSLPEDTRFRERKLHDMTLRLDGLYDIIVELEEKIEDVKLRRKAVEQDAITLENIYTLAGKL